MPSLRISIAMATYNGARYIAEQLDSLAAQTLLPAEMIVTDDRSTDETLDIVLRFAGSAPFPVRIIRNEKRLGYADNFLKAASFCSGDLIAFCDQDDIWMKEKLNTCAGFLANPEILLVLHSAQILKGSERGDYFPFIHGTRISGLGGQDPFPQMPRPGFAIVFSKRLLAVTNNYQRPPYLRGHDHWIWYLAASAGRIAMIPDVLALYRQHENNACGAEERISTLQKARERSKTQDYEQVADRELMCSEILFSAADGASNEWAQRLRESAHNLARRSQFHRMRAKLYDVDSNPIIRLAAFGTILFSGGYIPDAANNRLGLLGAAKDLLLGVSGIHRMNSQ